MWLSWLHPLQQFAAQCKEYSFFGLPTWYHYLNVAGKIQQDPQTGRCDFVAWRANGLTPADLSLIALAAVDILLRLAALVAIGYVMYGGFRLMTAQGDPNGTKNAQQTIWNGLIGLGIALAAIGGTAFLGGVIK